MNVKPPASPVQVPGTEKTADAAKLEKKTLIKPDSLFQSLQDPQANKDKQKIDSAKGQAKPHIELEPDYPLNSSHYPDGRITVQGFPAGNPPDIKDVLDIAFPFAKDIKVVGSNHQRPFDTYAIEVDGKPFTAEFLWGGVRAADSFQIKPGKSDLPMKPLKSKEISDKIEVKQAPHIQMEDAGFKKYEKIIPSKTPDDSMDSSLPQVERKKSGGMVVTFENGRPNIGDALRSAFPDAKEIKIVGSSHMRPFDNYHVMVDGKPFSASFLWGGIVASNQFNIEPGHKDAF